MLITVYDNPQKPHALARWFRSEGMLPVRTRGAEHVAMVGVKPAYLDDSGKRGTAREKTAMSAPTLAGT
jgi:hypothetical protein